MSMLLNFPDAYQPSESQKIILRGIEQAIANGTKFIVCNAPTGAGKSFFAPTLANYAGGPSDTWKQRVDDYTLFSPEAGPEYADEEPDFGVYALTITKSLQDQYTDTFDNANALKGKSNYVCDYDQDLTVDIAPCLSSPTLKKSCWSCNRCHYYNDRNKMLKSAFAVLNYSMYFALPEHLQRRKILILDEASELEDQLISHFTCEVDFAFLQKIGTSVPPFPSEEKAANVLKWLTQMIGNMNIKLEEYTQYFKDAKGKDSTFMKKKGEYTKLQNLINKVALLIQTYYESQYIIEHSDTGVKFTPLKIDKLSNYLFRNADTVIFLSATIIDHANFCKHLGVTDYKYIEVGSLFDPKKSPIYILAKQKLNFKNLKEMLPTLCDQVAGILSAHPNSKGIIHTHTQYIADYIRDRVKSNRLLCRMDGVKNEDILQQHFESTEPTVLVSPSMSYGVDLKGDLAEFQILLKAPWMPTKDPRVEKMMRMDSTWYSNKMLCTLVQACGRGVRAASDECETYILDGSIYDAIARNKSRLPKYFLDRIV